MARREFSKPVKVEILTRCKQTTGFRCEVCGAVVTHGQIDHTDADALQIDKTRKLTAEDGKFMCIPCHKAKTKIDVAMIARAKRIEARHLGADRPKGKIPSRPFANRKPREPKPSLPPRQLYR
jgi:hypothetical protein